MVYSIIYSIIIYKLYIVYNNKNNNTNELKSFNNFKLSKTYIIRGNI